MAKRTLKAAEAEIVVLKAKLSSQADARESLREALGELLSGVFATPDEAHEIAADAVSERIW